MTYDLHYDSPLKDIGDYESFGSHEKDRSKFDKDVK